MTFFILLEDGSALLQETGDNLLLNTISVQSLPIDFNNGIIISGTLTATFTVNTPDLFMTADGNNFESITNGSVHSFTNTGSNLQWKAEGIGTTITQLNIIDYH